MAKVIYADVIASVWGALDSVKDGQKYRKRLISRRHEYTMSANYDEHGNKFHQLFYYHFHEGEWSQSATRNRAIIKAAQRTAHDIEYICSHPEQFDSHIVAAALQWRLRHAAHLALPPTNGKRYTHFYNFVYVTLYREIREQLNAQSEREGRDQEAAICL